MNKVSFFIHDFFTFVRQLPIMIARSVKLLGTRLLVARTISIGRAILLLLLLVFAISGSSSRAVAATIQAGESFPELASFGLEGELPKLKGKVVLIDFFASWCSPCHESFPVMEQLHKDYSEKGFAIVAISVDKKKADLDRFLKKHPSGFTVLRDGSGKLATELKIPTMPTSFLVGRDGKIRSVHDGFHGDQTRKKYVSEIETLLKE